MKAPAVVAAAIACIVTLTPTVSGYSTYAKWGKLEAWFYVNPLNGDVSSSQAITALQSSMNVWNTQSGTPFRFWYAGQVGDTTTSNDKRNVILFRKSTNGGAIASTYSWTSNGVLVDSDIMFWDGGFKFFTGWSGCASGVYIEDVAAHELGHSMGLSHSNVAGATMTPGYLTCTMTQRSIESDDKAGAQKLYGTSAGATNPAPSNTAPSVTISSPANGISVTTATAVTFTGSATDTQQGNITSFLVWRSNLLGQIGTGGSFTRSLTAGTHAITATVTDSGGLTAQRGITAYVAAAPVANTAPVVTITSPANGATVTAGTTVTFTGLGERQPAGESHESSRVAVESPRTNWDRRQFYALIDSRHPRHHRYRNRQRGLDGSTSSTVYATAASRSATQATLAAPGLQTQGAKS